MKKDSSFSISSIGIQTIMPKRGTAQPPQHPRRQPANDNGADDSTADDEASAEVEIAAQQAPPPPGMGQLLDKTV